MEGVVAAQLIFILLSGSVSVEHAEHSTGQDDVWEGRRIPRGGKAFFCFTHQSLVAQVEWWVGGFADGLETRRARSGSLAE